MESTQPTYKPGVTRIDRSIDRWTNLKGGVHEAGVAQILKAAHAVRDGGKIRGHHVLRRAPRCPPGPAAAVARAGNGGGGLYDRECPCGVGELQQKVVVLNHLESKEGVRESKRG